MCFYYQLKSLSPNSPNSLSKLLIQRKSLFKKISDLKNLAIQESTHFRFVILVIILSIVKINFSRYLSLSWLFRYCLILSSLFLTIFVTTIFLAQITQATQINSPSKLIHSSVFYPPSKYASL